MGRPKGSEVRPFEERLWSKIDTSGGEDAHWLWTSFKNQNGYGLFKDEVNQAVLAHRVVYIRTVGPIPPGHIILHLCDIPACCNPRHLALGTQSDNVRDMDRKGRRRFGPLKLNIAKARAIRALYLAGGRSQESLAVQFGVSLSLINAILHDKRWREIGTVQVTDAITLAHKARGERTNTARVTAEIVRDLRERSTKAVDRHLLATELGVTDRTIRDIIAHRTWKHLP